MIGRSPPNKNGDDSTQMWSCHHDRRGGEFKTEKACHDEPGRWTIRKCEGKSGRKTMDVRSAYPSATAKDRKWGLSKKETSGRQSNPSLETHPRARSNQGGR